MQTLLQTASGQASTLRILAQPSWKLNGFSASYFLDSPNVTSPKAFPLHHSFLDEPSSSQPPLVGFSSIMTSFTAYSNMFHILAIALFALLVDVTFAQTLISSTLPACAQQCPVLIQAQGGCVPPAAPVTNQGIYQSCFCQSTFLQPLYGGPTPLCPSCPPADMTTIQNWFQGLCKPGAPQGGQQPAPTTTTPSTSISATAAATSSAGLTGVNETATPSGPQPGWYKTPPSCPHIKLIYNSSRMSTHWRWVVMLIVLFIGLSLVALGFWLLHRRYRHRKAAQGTTPAATQPDLWVWAPGQSVHDFGAGVGAANNEKGKGREQVNDAPSAEPPAGTKRVSRVLKKGWLGNRG